MKIIGLTGGIGSGKSVVAQFLEELGATVIYLDRVGHNVLEQEKVRKQLASEFGKDILDDNGDIDRTRLGKLVFGNTETLSRLNEITHPVIDGIVNDRIEDYRREGVKAVVLEAAALLEAGRAPQFDEIWVTTAPGAVKLKRLTEKAGYTVEEAKARIKSQMSGEERVGKADVVIDTDCTLDELKTRMAVEWQKLLTRL